MRRHLLAVLFLGAIAVGVIVSCTKPLFPDDAHVWGSYNACLRRVRDTCHSPSYADGGCFSAVSATPTLSIALASDQRRFLLARPPLSTVEGTQNQERFEVTHNITAASGLSRQVCGCDVNVRETIRGELLTTAPDVSLCDAQDGGADASVDSCSPLGTDSPDAGVVDWLSGAHETLDLQEKYPAVRGTIINEVQPASGDACGCAPCVIEYEYTGTQ